MDGVPVLEGVVGLLGDDERVTALAEGLLRRVPPELDSSPPELAARVRSIFSFVERRKKPIAVRAFNPTDEHGFATHGTIVEVNLADSPFLLDSVTNEIEAHGVGVRAVLHPVLGIDRDADGVITAFRHPREAEARESVQHYELDRRLFDADLPALEAAIAGVLSAVRSVVMDFEPLRSRVERMIGFVRDAAGHVPDADLGEAEAFLRWLVDDNFVFLGYREYRIFDTPDGVAVQADGPTGLRCWPTCVPRSPSGMRRGTSS